MPEQIWHGVMSKKVCPSCGGHLSMCIGINSSEPPSVGDITFCWHCSEVLEFTEGFGIRVFTKPERHELSADLAFLICRTRFRILSRIVRHSSKLGQEEYSQ